MSVDEQAGLTVVTWNAQGSHGLDISKAATALLEFQPQLVLLQEVQRRHVRALGAAMHAPSARWRFKHWPGTVPPEGLGVLSTIPLRRVRTRVLAHRWEFWNWRRRVALEVQVGWGGRVVTCVDVHLGAGVSSTERIRQAQLVQDRCANAMIIAGDLNAEPNSAELARFGELGWRDAERSAHPGAARPSTNWHGGPRVAAPTQRLDYILVRDSIEVQHAFVPTDWERWAELSDHVPVVAQLRT